MLNDNSNEFLLGVKSQCSVLEWGGEKKLDYETNMQGPWLRLHK